MTKQVRHKKSKLVEKVEYLNESALAIDKALKKIKKVFNNDNDVDVLLYRIQKGVGELHRCIILRLQREVDEEQFNDAIKGFELPFKNRKNLPPNKKQKKRK